jgi:hypothetical protein
MDDRHPDSFDAREAIEVSGAGWRSSASTRRRSA